MVMWIILFMFLVCVQGFFSGIEVGLISIDRIKLKELVARKNKSAIFISKILDNIENILTVSLIGVNLSVIAGSIISTNEFLPYFIGRFGAFWGKVIMSGCILTPIVVIFAEILPKEIYRQKALRLVLRSTFLIRVARFIFYIPAVIVKNMISVFLPKKQKESFFLNKEELEQIINISNKSGVLTPGEKEMMEGIFDLSTTQVKEIMTQRVNVVAVAEDSEIDELMTLAQEHGHSRFPVYGESIDDIKGFVFILDIIYEGAHEKNDHKLSDYIRNINFVPETKKVDKLFREMKMSQEQIRMVIDEYGQVSGLISLEDIIEEIVGEINDEFDEVEESSVVSQDGELIIDSSIPVEELNERYELNIPEGEEYDTLAGFLEDYTGVIPNVNQVIKWEDYSFTIRSKQKNSIGKVKINIKNIETEEKDVSR
ncbi:MAG: hypothetical protein C0601_00370 [Candidatus Muiribacterium halophilum]|uniref:HlyC/CorC family transporter n=1 Tax=Muiribacterium halophilum TaxID=2053465 RepID=A0A2N5ZN48_MUIH1|nr:MAG: hypothetical protein C0601_00370 [Candidatus Muirbacterium halophilum]